MRVVAGTAKGRKLIAPEGSALTRPTTDKVKEAVFGKLQFKMQGTLVLDLFCGSGAMGIEALSRGAERAIFIDSAKEAIACTKENLRNTTLLHKATVFCEDYKQAMLRWRGTKFDFIFLDPPYGAGFYEEALRLIFSYELLAENGLIIAEHDEAICLQKYEIESQKRYGTVYISYIVGDKK